MRIVPLLAGLHALALPAIAPAADWWWVQDSGKTRSMVERGSIARSGAWATAWVQDFFVSPMDANQFSARYLIQHDCARGETAVLSGQAFDGEGRPLTAPVPDRPPVGREDFREVCTDNWSGAMPVGDIEGEVRMWRVSNDM